MDSVGLVFESRGNEVELLVQSEQVELGSILKLEGYYGIVSAMRYREDDKIGGRHKLSATVQIFGEKTSSGFRKMKKPVEPYTKAVLPGDDELESLIHCLDEISVGVVHGTNARAYINGGEYDRHTAVLASTGAGKSFLAANLIKEYSLKGLPVLVVDTHGEFSKILSLIKTSNPMDVEVYTIGKKKQGFKNFTIPVSTLTCNDYTHFTSLNENQYHALDMVLNSVFKEMGEKYSLEDVVSSCEMMAEKAGEGKVKVHEETAKALERRLRGLKNIFQDIFNVDGTDLNNLVQPYRITIIDTSLATQGVRRSVISYISKKLLDGRINKKHVLDGEVIDHETLFVIEEAHNYAGANLTHSCKSQLQRIAGEGRKFGIGLLVVSQKPSKIDEEILSQCNTGIYMHITNPRDKDHIRRSFESINDEIIRDLDSLDVGECIITGAMVKLPFILCSVDRITMPEDKKSKLQFKKPEKIKPGKFDYA